MTITPGTQPSSTTQPLECASDTRARLDGINVRIARACERSGRSASEVTLMAVSKTVPASRVLEAVSCGIKVLGENRVQEAAEKMKRLAEVTAANFVEWHFIGHLQSNKSRRAVELFETIHSVDSVKLAERLDRAADETGRRTRVFIEVNLGGEASKSGIARDELLDSIAQVAHLRHIELVGLMTVPPFLENPADVRPYFTELRELRDRAREIAGPQLSQLSMGMSHDFEVAIEEGATTVRVGTALFGSRK